MGPASPSWLTLPEEEFHSGYRPAGNLTSGYLNRVLVRALGAVVEAVPPDSALKQKPLVLNLSLPLPPRLRFYLYQATQHASERQQGTYKVQLTSGVEASTSPLTGVLPRQSGPRRLYFDRTDGIRPVVMGYHPEWHLFILWDADLHDLGEGFGYSKSIQAPPEIIGKALARGLAQGNRKLQKKPEETIIAARPRRLAEAIKLRIRLSNDAMVEGLF
ncbi:hypothetical protein ACWEPM_00260 [Streptomyces sp. NPDC004244]